MNNREEFEKFCRELYNTGFYHENSYVLNYHDLIGVKVDAEYMMYKAWQYQQKIIDELKANNFALSAMVCKHPDKRSLDENYDTIKDYCDMLKEENKKLEKKIETFQESTKTYLDLLRKEGI